MGGLVTIGYLQNSEKQKEFAGVILSAPPVDIPEQVSAPVLMTAKALSAVAPETGVEKLKTDTLSTDKNEVDKYNADPLIYHDSIKARTGLELVLASQQAKDGWAKQISVPVFYIQGMKDRMVPSGAAEPFFKGISSKSKIFYKFVEGYHETHLDVNRKKLFEFMTNWLNETMVKGGKEGEEIVDIHTDGEKEKE